MEILTEVIKWSYFWKYDYGERHNCLLIMLMQGVILMKLIIWISEEWLQKQEFEVN
jgi:hypothetical protein